MVKYRQGTFDIVSLYFVLTFFCRAVQYVSSGVVFVNTSAAHQRYNQET